MNAVFEFLFHLDTFLTNFISQYGLLIYLLTFLILFAETGLFAPLPGDSLIFACAAFAAAGLLNIWVLAVICFTAAFFGDMLNYYIGHSVGKRLYNRAKGRFFSRENIDKAQIFYDKHGGKAIILSRFVPIIRQFTPFVAGIGRMHYRRFMTFNIVGVISWVTIASVLGYFFGNIPVVKKNFSTVILVIILVSLLPVIISFFKAKILRKSQPKKEA